jgi:hypothetical protein
VTAELHILLGSIVGGTGALLSYWAGWRARGRLQPPRGSYGQRKPSFAELLMPLSRDQDPDWRRSFNHENTKRPSGPPPLRLRRSNPFVSEFQQQINDASNLDGYQPRPPRPGANPPPSEP